MEMTTDCLWAFLSTEGASLQAEKDLNRYECIFINFNAISMTQKTQQK